MALPGLGNLLNNAMSGLGQATTTFTEFVPQDDIVDGVKTTITRGLWTGDNGTLLTFFTSSDQSDSQFKYYVNSQESASSAGQTQFATAYGNRHGSGSSTQGSLNDSTTKAIYSQYRLLLLDSSDSQFTFKTGEDTTKNSDEIYVVNFQRARMRERLDPGNFQLNLCKLSGSNTFEGATLAPNSASIGTGSMTLVGDVGATNIIKLIDDSGDSNQVISTAGGKTEKVYNIVSGTIADGIYTNSGGGKDYYGLAYPENGVLIMDPAMLNESCSFNTVTASNVEGYNAFKLFYSISASAALNANYGFQARNSEVVTSQNYFVRVKANSYNFSNNPTWTTSSGLIKQQTFWNDPKSYVTSVGLYNTDNELLAVAKLSKPLIKSFENELLIKVKLDF